MIITATLKDGISSIEANIETDQDCISICFGNTSYGINVYFNNEKIVAYIYPQDATGPEIITLSTR